MSLDADLATLRNPTVTDYPFLPGWHIILPADDAEALVEVTRAAREIAPMVFHAMNCPRGGSLPGACNCGKDEFDVALARLDGNQ